RHPSLAASDLEFHSEHHYTRFLCHKLCDNLKYRSNLQESVDALQLIYRPLLEFDRPPSDLNTHLLVLRTLWAHAADIRTHRSVAIVPWFVFKSMRWDLPEWEQSPSIFSDEAWFRAVLGLDNDEQTERPSARQVDDCVRVGVVTTFFEQCAAQSPDRTERGLDVAMLKEVCEHTGIRSIIPIKLQRRFANAFAAFIRKYPEDCLADWDDLYSVLVWAVGG
ncbi:unnamed protein product, partial [Mycena citricolor]